jgi:hypothetical protein
MTEEGVNGSLIKLFCKNWPTSQAQTSKLKHCEKVIKHVNQQCRNDPFKVMNTVKKEWDQSDT